MSSARMMTTLGGPGGGIGEAAATGGAGNADGVVGELPPQASMGRIRAAPRTRADGVGVMGRAAPGIVSGLGHACLAAIRAPGLRPWRAAGYGCTRAVANRG